MMNETLKPLLNRSIFLMLLCIYSHNLYAEGTYQMDAAHPQYLETDTLMFVHVDGANKYIRLHLCRQSNQSGQVYADIYSTNLVSGKYVKNAKLADLTSTVGNISCSDPMTNPLPATPSSGEVMHYQVSSAGVYAVDLSELFDNYQRWDISVVDNVGDSVDPMANDGNLFSYLWRFDTPGSTEPYAADTRMYILAPGGFANTNYVWAADLQNFAGDIHKVLSNSIGLNPPYSGTSNSLSFSIDEKFPTYLSYPKGASPSPAPSSAAQLTDTLSFIDSAGNDNEITPNGDTIEDTGTFSFTPNATGTYAISVAALGGSYQVILQGEMQQNVTVNHVWDGKDADGNAMVPAKYDVKLTLKLGESHFVVKDVETSGGGTNNGLTILQATDETTLVGTQVYWDDTPIGGSTNLPSGTLSSLASVGTHRHTWGDFTFTSIGDLNYIDTYVYGLSSDFATEAINVNASAPTVTSNGGGHEAAIEVNEGSTLVTNVVATGGSGSYTYSIFGGDSALFNIDASGELTFLSAPDYETPLDADTNNDYLLFVRVDGGGTLEYIHQELTISVNNIPSSTPQSISVTEDTPTSITLTAADIDLDTLSYSITNSPNNGVLSGTLPNLTYTPNSDYNGADTFSFKVNDGFTDSNTATISINVSPINDTPSAGSQSIPVTEDTPTSITLTATDIDLDSLSYSLLTSPANGSLSGTPPNLTYTPAANYAGGDSFTFIANDGNLISNTASITITVSAVNDAPTSNNQSITVTEDTPKTITLIATDVEADSLTFSLISSPSKGVLTGTLPNLTYTPNLNETGADSFTFKVNDGAIDSNIATVSININAINDAPISNNQSVTVAEDTPKAITLIATDVEADSLTFSLISSPSKGVLTGTLPNLTYTPNLNETGADSFTFKVNDGAIDSNIATVSININAINDAPISNNQSVTVAEDTPKAITLIATDVEADSLTFSLISSPSKGVLTGTLPNLTYTPNLNETGADSFTFKVNDGAIDSNIATVSININAINDAPISNNQSVTVAEDTPKAITLIATDVEANSLTFSLISSASKGALTGTLPNLTYTPNLNETGADSFTFKVNDGALDSNIATVSINIDAINDAPISNNQSVTVTEDTPKAITLTATDVEASSLTFSVISAPSKGVLTGTLPNLTYTPNLNETGADSFTFKVNDGAIDSNIATVSINIDAINDAPISNNQSVTVAEDTPKAIILTAIDVEAGSLTFSVISSPSKGVLTGTLPNLTYTPNLNETGADNFTFKVNDGAIDSNIATVSINIDAINDAPIAGGQSIEMVQASSIELQLNATDTEGSPLSYVIVSSPQNGTLMGSGPNLTYQPTESFSGDDSFTFKANDTESDSNIALITILVLPDLDRDGISDSDDLDDDGDGILDVIEGDSDSDGDGIPNRLDTDSDNDGIPDSEEGLVDSDGDGIADYLDSSQDEDRDGIPDIVEGNFDSDLDGIINYLDIDSDNDGLVDGFEAGISGEDSDNDGIDDLFDVQQTKGRDTNNDGIDDDIDLIDSDSDGKPNYLDIDSDNDWIPDAIEATYARVDLDSDGITDLYDIDMTQGDDSDGDGIDDRFDIDNTGHFDADNDGISDAKLEENDNDHDGLADHIDIDSDNDGIIDTSETVAQDIDEDNDGIADIFDPDFTPGDDSNADGIIDNIQLTDSDADNVIDMHDLDSDNDGLLDINESGGTDINHDGLFDANSTQLLTPTDTDLDTIPDFIDLDSDNDGIMDITNTPAATLDKNSDGRIDLSNDDDADGIDNSYDNMPNWFGTAAPIDHDNDGIPSALDKDNDNDGLSDITEGRGDFDQDNVADYLDRDSDNDGLSDTVENNYPAPMNLDHDKDGIDNAWDVDITGGIDTDNDGIDDQFTPLNSDLDSQPNHLDLDSDNDSISDTREEVMIALSKVDNNQNGIDDTVDVEITMGVDENFDGIDDSLLTQSYIDDDDIPNFIDSDSDNDTIPDSIEGDIDSDKDNSPNFIDLDSDNDGIPDIEEGVIDTDTDGIPNYLDDDSDNDGILDRNENADTNRDGVNDRLQANTPVELVGSSSGALGFTLTLMLALFIFIRRKIL
ncbi:Ig-like domain-containing protein [Shewanella woodyi]|uniref:Outer membrane adhesin like protein n=1 Tax=Shewanella woodyi (strain ATCC 51908 / MS32) TaxID=392500 RepID=B1KR56_SHEWM|nr:Ig-like domain-containing protein [Shewanella woodyi]ACA84873.1 outer membrane adhesin like protein [Shewanella woodyi ATCC 51908]